MASKSEYIGEGGLVVLEIIKISYSTLNQLVEYIFFPKYLAPSSVV